MLPWINQKGSSFFSTLLIGSVLLFAVSATIKMFPHYMDFHTMETIVERAQSDTSVSTSSPEVLQAYIQKMMSVNNIRDIDLKQALHIDQDASNSKIWTVRLEYDTHELLLANLGIVAHFSKIFQVAVR